MSYTPPDPAGALLFDLDGTLLDTAADLAVALNRLLAEERRALLPLAQVRPKVSHGGAALIALAFPELAGAVDARSETLRQRLLAHYRANLATHTRLFAGFDALLVELQRRALPWGIVTNKPGWLTEPLLAELGLRQLAGSVISGDTFAERKPHPRPLLAAAAELGVEPERCIYVGDALRDIQAAKAAGMRAVVARFGYISPDDGAEQWPADAWIDRPAELLAMLGPPAASPQVRRVAQGGPGGG